MTVDTGEFQALTERVIELEERAAALEQLLKATVKAALQLHGAGEDEPMRKAAARMEREPRHLKAVK